MALPDRFARREFRRRPTLAGEALARELQSAIELRVLRSPEPRLELLSVIDELEGLGHRLRYSPKDSYEDAAVWVAGDLAVWVHGEVTSVADVRRIERIEVLWRRM